MNVNVSNFIREAQHLTQHNTQLATVDLNVVRKQNKSNKTRLVSLTCGIFPFPIDPFLEKHEALCSQRVGVL